VGVVIDAVVAVAVEEIKAALQRQVALGLAHVPLADDAADVAGRLEQVAERALARIQAQGHLRRHRILLGRVAVAEIDQVVAHHVVETVALRVATRQQAAARGRAGGPGDVKMRRPHAGGGEPVEVRRFNRFQAQAAEVGPALVVADEQHHVGRRGRQCTGGEQADQEAQQHDRRKRPARRANFRGVAWKPGSGLDGTPACGPL